MHSLKLLAPPAQPSTPPCPRRVLDLSELVPGDPLATSDLRAYAKYFAREFEFKPERAMWEIAAWYRMKVGGDICSDSEARLMREMTIEECCYVASGAELDAALANYDPNSGRELLTWTRAAKNLGEFVLVAGMLVALAIGAAILEPQDDAPSSTQHVAAPVAAPAAVWDGAR